VVHRGRKKAALLYVLTYTIGCFTKHWGLFMVLLVGRLFCGIATSLLYSAFESWLVAEHFKACPSCFVLTYAAHCC
jgi:MFS transporter, MFS domain-containing protein family, molybdate-anion transporter